jgi:hypothetical protein
MEVISKTRCAPIALIVDIKYGEGFWYKTIKSYIDDGLTPSLIVFRLARDYGIKASMGTVRRAIKKVEEEASEEG